MRRLRKGSGLVLGLLWLLMADAVWAEATRQPFGVFEMLEGQGIEVCEACFKAFEAIAGTEKLGGCERNYDSEYGLSAPEWTDLPPLTHLALLKHVMLFMMPLDPESHIGHGRSSMYEGTIYETEETFRQKIKVWLKYERLGIEHTMADIDNDGRPEPLFAYRTGYCTNPYAPSPDRVLLVLTSNRKSIETTKTDLVTQNASKGKQFPAGIYSEKMYDVFFFKGQTYFDKYDRGQPSATVTVYHAKGKNVTSLCKFRYEIPYRPQSSGGQP